MSQDFNDSRVNPAFSEISLTPSPDDHPPTRNEKENLKKVSVRLNVNYLKSLMGILTLIEMVFTLCITLFSEVNWKHTVVLVSWFISLLYC